MYVYMLVFLMSFLNRHVLCLVAEKPVEIDRIIGTELQFLILLYFLFLIKVLLFDYYA